MTNSTLAQSYLVKARSRLKILDVLLGDDNYSDVIREAQEIVELALKAILRQIGIEPPHVHDVGALLRQYRQRLAADVAGRVDELAEASAWLRKEREFSFYGEIDFIPTEQYTRAEAQRAIDDARLCVDVATGVVTTVAPAAGSDTAAPPNIKNSK